MKFGAFLLALGFVCVGVVAFAGHGDSMGNGGTVMVCKDHIVSYDIYEGQVQRGLFPQMGAANLDYLQKVEMVLSRIPAQNAELREQLENYFAEFQNQSMIGNFDLVPVDDAGQLVIEPGCQIHQAAVQREPVTSNDKRYLLDQKIWQQLDNDSKAALVLHEIVYRMTISQGHTTSVGARALNSYLMDSRVLAQQPCIFTSLLEDLHLATMDFFQFGDLKLLASSSVITPTCQVREAVVVDGFVLVNHQKIFPAVGNAPFEKGLGPAVAFNDNGSLKNVLIDSEQELKVGNHIYQLGLGEQGLGELQFDQNGTITRATVNNIDVVVSNQHIVATQGMVFFAADGTVTGVSSVKNGFNAAIDGFSFEKVWRMEVLENQQLRLWVPHEVSLQTSQAEFKFAGLFYFAKDQSLFDATLTQPTTLKLQQQSCLAAETNVQFYPHHWVHRFVAAEPCRLTTASGQSQQVQAGDIVVLDESGRVLKTNE